jgi:hypothetical protein
MTDVVTALVGRGEERSADMCMVVDIGASSGKGRVMTVSAVTHPAAPRAVSAS